MFEGVGLLVRIRAFMRVEGLGQKGLRDLDLGVGYIYIYIYIYTYGVEIVRLTACDPHSLASEVRLCGTRDRDLVVRRSTPSTWLQHASRVVKNRRSFRMQQEPVESY